MIKIGADPEFFLRRGQHFVSGHVVECGHKLDPTKTANGFIQNDGVAVEVNVTPATSRTQFIKNCQSVVEDLITVVQKRDKSLSIVARPTVYFGEKFLKKLPEEVSELGCNPDFNAWTGKMNPRPNEKSPIRTGSGHVHLGFTENVLARNRAHYNVCCQLVRQLDYFVGLPSLEWDTDNRRRSLYGQAGAFRPKHYGLEYRVLSNAWLNSDRLMGFVFDQTQKAYERFVKGDRLEDKYADVAVSIIQSNDVNWGKTYPELKQMIYG